MKIVASPYLIECHKCHNMSDNFVVKNSKLICLSCLNKHKLLKLQKKENLRPRQRKLFKYQKWDPGKLIYATDGITSIVSGGGF